MPIFAGSAVINPVAVADSKPLLGAVPPDRVLNEPRKDGRKRPVELPGVNRVGNCPNDFGTAARPVTARSIWVGRVESGQDADPGRRTPWRQGKGVRGPGKACRRGGSLWCHDFYQKRAILIQKSLKIGTFITRCSSFVGCAGSNARQSRTKERAGRC